MFLKNIWDICGNVTHAEKRDAKGVIRMYEELLLEIISKLKFIEVMMVICVFLGWGAVVGIAILMFTEE